MNYVQTSAELTKWKREPERIWLREVSCVPVQQSLRHLDQAFQRFFKKLGKYPNFKKRGHRQAATYVKTGFNFSSPDPSNPNLSISGLGRLRVKWSRSFKSEPSSVTIVKEPSGKYYVSVVVEESFSKLPCTGKSVGIDLGINWQF